MIEANEIPGKIIVIRLSSIGDIVLTTPLLRGLKRAYPDAEIDFIVKKRYQEILSGNPNISNIIAFDENLGFKELNRIKKIVINNKYDWLIDIHKNLRSLYLRSGVGTSRLFRYHKHRIQRFLLIKFKLNFYRSIVPVCQRYMQELKPFGIQDDGEGPEVFVDTNAKQRVDKQWGNFFHRNPLIVGMVPGAGYQTKRWLPEGFAEVGERLIKNDGVAIILFGGPQDKQLHAEIKTRIHSDNVISLAGKTTLQESIAAMAECDCVVSNDTGFMHVAVALKKKLVAIFGATTEELGFFPNAKEQIILQNNNLACRPCTHIGTNKCPKHHFKCMRDIIGNEVYRAVREIISQCN